MEYWNSGEMEWWDTFLDSRSTVLVQDEIETEKPAEIWWFAHTPGTITIGPDKRHATISRAGKKLEAVLLSPPGAAFVAMDASPLPGSPNPTKQEKNRNYRKLAIHCQGQKLTLAVAFTPHYDVEEPASSNVPLNGLSQWSLPPDAPQLAGVKIANELLETFRPVCLPTGFTWTKTRSESQPSLPPPGTRKTACKSNHFPKFRESSKLPLQTNKIRRESRSSASPF